LVARYLRGQEHGPRDTYEVKSSIYGYVTSRTRGRREIGRVNVVLIPEAGDTTWGPYLPQEEPPASQNQRKVILELQECSIPIPRTGDLSIDSLCEKSHRKETKFSGRLMNSKADLGLISYWINNCREHHGDKCAKSIWSASARQTLISLLLIDVERMCIVDSPEGSSYTALSYCWGKAATLKHTTHNSQHLRKHGALLDPSIPATIKDAMSLVKGIGERYLWVDALCIVQDDSSSQAVQLAQMGLVYSLASFVIIAAAGDDANAGLPGIRFGTRRAEQDMISIGGKTLVTVVDGLYYGGVGTSHWATRAWTMQEKVLAKRTLIFTEEQIYWRCVSATWLEETALENVSNPDLNRHHAIAGPSDIDFSVAVREYYRCYEMLVVTYMQRQLSFKSDIINAFTGITQALSAVGDDTFHWGMPESQFGFALSWNFVHDQTRNSALCTVFSKSGPVEVPYPSWSWAAWVSGSVNKNWIDWTGSTEDEPDIIICRQNADGELQRVRHDRRRSKDFPSSYNQSLDLKHQWIGSPQVITELSRQPCAKTFDQGHLHFWTSTARLWIRRQTHLQRGPIYSLLVPNKCGDGFEDGGQVNIDSSAHLLFRDPEEVANAPQNIFSHIKNHNDEDFGKQNDVLRREMIVIGRVGRRGDTKLSALVTEWDGEITYRIGITRVEESIWVRLRNREWKRVILG
jgi:hypothetical protein